MKHPGAALIDKPHVIARRDSDAAISNYGAPNYRLLRRKVHASQRQCYFLSAILFIITSLLSTPVTANETDYRTAYDYLQQKDYPAAKESFSRLSGYAARLGEGNAAYHMADYKAAAQQFNQALFDASNDQQRGEALFNLANSRYQLSEYRAAEKLYTDVLRYLPNHTGAITNLEYAKALQSEAIKSTRTAHRAGTGAQTGEAPEGMSTEGVRGLTLGDQDPQPVLQTSDGLTTRARPPGSIRKGTTASSKVDTDGDREWQYRLRTLEQLQRENPPITSSHATFWQRLYEQEEGFPAPLEQAEQLPGVKPW